MPTTIAARTCRTAHVADDSPGPRNNARTDRGRSRFQAAASVYRAVVDHDDIDALTACAESLIDSWRSTHDDSFRMRRRNRSATEGQFAVIFGLSSHVHNVAAELLPACRRGLTVVELPLIRVAYESAISAQWVAQVDDGVNALYNEEIRQRRNLQRTLLKSVSTVFREGAESLTHTQNAPLESESSARAFEQRCLDLSPGGSDAYSLYRILSMASHATLDLCDEYLQEDAQGVLHLVPEGQRRRDAAAWTSILCSSLVWAGRAVDYFDDHHRRRSELRRVARDLGISSELQLSDHYRTRIAQLRQQVRGMT